MAQRYFVPDMPPPGTFELERELAHHLGTVLRIRPGAAICLADGRGNSAPATVTQAERRRVTVEVGPAGYHPRTQRSVHLAFAVPRHHRAEWLFEHGTEVGVAVFWPLRTERTRVQGERLERWQKLTVAAAGQCDRDWLPTVQPVMDLQSLLSCPELPAARQLAEAGGAAPHGGTDDVVLLVGPEGGFSADEKAAATAAGFAPVGLGPHVLRTETAALVGAALLMQ